MLSRHSPFITRLYALCTAYSIANSAVIYEGPSPFLNVSIPFCHDGWVGRCFDFYRKLQQNITLLLLHETESRKGSNKLTGWLWNRQNKTLLICHVHGRMSNGKKTECVRLWKQQGIK